MALAKGFDVALKPPHLRTGLRRCPRAARSARGEIGSRIDPSRFVIMADPKIIAGTKGAYTMGW